MSFYKEIKVKSLRLSTNQLAFLNVVLDLFTKIDDNKLDKLGSYVRGDNPFEIVLQHAECKEKCIVFILHGEFLEISSHLFTQGEDYHGLIASELRKKKLRGLIESYFKGDYNEFEFYYKRKLVKTEIEWKENMLPKAKILHVTYLKYMLYYLNSGGKFAIKKTPLASFY